MNICESNKEISRDLVGFIQNVANIKEESITDYLTWKWRESDKRFNYINIEAFSKEQENKTTGADFEIELWLIGNRVAFPLLIQAKKLIPEYNSYCNKLNYPNGSQQQLTKLLSYSKIKKRIPFYIFYSIPKRDTKFLCNGHAYGDAQDCSILLTDAYVVKDFADKYKNKKLSKTKILNRSNPFHCIFCCPAGAGRGLPDYFCMYYPNVIDKIKEWQLEYNSNNLPSYVRMLLSKEVSNSKIESMIKEQEIDYCRHIAAYDLSRFD